MSRIEVLDHGHATLIESWGSDEGIIEAARMSTNKGFKGWGPVPCGRCSPNGRVVRPSGDQIPDLRLETCTTCRGAGETAGDEKLLRYLYENKHSTPFEMAGLAVEIKAPIFVFRQWHRHRTQSYNEMSARYTPLPDENYIPTVERLTVNATKNKQAGTIAGARELTPQAAELIQLALGEQYETAEAMYQKFLEAGVPKELARIHLPVARYSQMRASANLRNWLAFLTLRMDTHAQYEIRVYADAVGQFIQTQFPRTWELFTESKNES